MGIQFQWQKIKGQSHQAVNADTHTQCCKVFKYQIGEKKYLIKVFKYFLKIQFLQYLQFLLLQFCVFKYFLKYILSVPLTKLRRTEHCFCLKTLNNKPIASTGITYATCTSEDFTALLLLDLRNVDVN